MESAGTLFQQPGVIVNVDVAVGDVLGYDPEECATGLGALRPREPLVALVPGDVDGVERLPALERVGRAVTGRDHLEPDILGEPFEASRQFHHSAGKHLQQLVIGRSHRGPTEVAEGGLVLVSHDHASARENGVAPEVRHLLEDCDLAAGIVRADRRDGARVAVPGHDHVIFEIPCVHRLCSSPSSTRSICSLIQTVRINILRRMNDELRAAGLDRMAATIPTRAAVA
jgi:hypothetical protein